MVEIEDRTSLVFQWLRIYLPMQGTWVWSLVQEDSTCCGATKPLYHNYWTCTLLPVLCNEKPPQWEAHAPQLESSPHSLQLEKPCVQQQRPRVAKCKINKKTDEQVRKREKGGWITFLGFLSWLDVHEAWVVSLSKALLCSLARARIDGENKGKGDVWPRTSHFSLGLDSFIQGQDTEGQFILLKCSWPKGSAGQEHTHDSWMMLTSLLGHSPDKESTPGDFCFLWQYLSLCDRAVPRAWWGHWGGRQPSGQ